MLVGGGVADVNQCFGTREGGAAAAKTHDFDDGLEFFDDGLGFVAVLRTLPSASAQSFWQSARYRIGKTAGGTCWLQYTQI